MKTTIAKTALLLILTVGSTAMKGQNIQDILSKLNLFQQKHPEEIVYLQTDRSLFSPGERLWFSAYVIADIGERILGKELYVGIIDPYGTEVASAKYRIMGSHFQGDLDIPAQVSPGKYMLIAYTGWMQHSPADRIFTRELEIRRIAPPFTVQMLPATGVFKDGNRFNAGVICLDAKKRPLEVALRYSLTIDGNKVVQGTSKTDGEGKANVTVTLPAGSGALNPELNIEGTVDGVTQGSTVIIPTPENILKVAFFPEGGMLVAGTRRKIAFRAYNAFGKPVRIEAEVHDNNGPAGKVSTDNNGLGTFLLTPQDEQSYWLKVTVPSGIADTFALPEPLRSGVALSLKSHTAESLVFQFEQVNRRIQNYHFIAQMKGRVYWMESRRVNTSTELTVPLGDFPSGIAEVVVFDSALTSVSSRLVCVNPERRLTIQIIPDKSAYGPKEKIGLTLKSLDENGKPVPAEISLSAVSPAGASTYSDGGMFTWIALKTDLSGYVPIPSGFPEQGSGEVSLLDDLLITAKYSRFDWARVLRTMPGSAADVYPDSTGNTAWLNYNLQAAVHAKNQLALETIPGVAFPMQLPNDPAAWSQNGTSQAMPNLYNGRLSIPEIIYQIRPYSISNGKIFFDNNSISTLSYPEGAIIALNGKLTGTDITVLNGILPTDIDHISVSTRSADIQKYTSLNSVGVIEVFTKVNDQFKNKAEDAKNASAAGFRTPAVFEARAIRKPPFEGAQATLFWKPVIHTDANGTARLEFNNAKKASEISIRAEGTTATGLSGGQAITIPLP